MATQKMKKYTVLRSRDHITGTMAYKKYTYLCANSVVNTYASYDHMYMMFIYTKTAIMSRIRRDWER